MKRRPITVVLFALLAVAVGLIVWRRAEGPPVPEGFAVIQQPEHLERASFRLDEPTRVAVEASGSAGADGVLEAYAWVLDARTRKVVWRMTAARARKAEGTRRVQRDTLQMAPGTYELYFTPHGRAGEDDNPGSRIVDRRFQWRNDAAQWYAVMKTVGAGTQPVRLSDDDLPTPDGLVWRSPRQGYGEPEETILEVRGPAAVDATFVGSEIGAGSVARIERLSDAVVLWEAQASQARPAGGAPRNRRVQAVVPLAPGLYRAVARTTNNHGPRHWQANPPDDPRAWGLTLTTVSGTVRPLELWTGRVPLVRLRGDRGDADLAIRVEVTQPATVAVYGMGEVTGDVHDYGWLENEASGERVWEMRRENTTPAGGGEKNREGQAVLTLAPGTYVLHYRTDGTHHLGEFNDEAPPHEERYGAALFLLGPEGAARAGTLPPTVSSEDAPEGSGEAVGTAPDTMKPPPLSAVTNGGVPAPPPVQGALASIVRMGNGERRSVGFVLRGEDTVRIYATGEFSGASDYDAAWITNMAGETVWRMAEATLRPAGGDDRNRYCDEIVRLRSGTYTVHYTTDGSHAYDDFGDGPPAFPESWGVIVTRAR